MSRPKLNHYSYYNFQLPTPEKARLQELAQSQGKTLSNLLLDYVRVCDLLRQAAKGKDDSIEVWIDGSHVVVSNTNNGRIEKI